MGDVDGAIPRAFPASPVPDPADLPEAPVGEVPHFVQVPAQARQVLRRAGLPTDVFARALDEARRQEMVAQLVWAAQCWAEGHPHTDVCPDDEAGRRAKDTDLLLAVKDYEEVAGVE